MSITEAERHEIYELIKQATSDRVANNIMTLFPPVGWADVATKTDLRGVQTELRAVETSLRAEILRLDAKVDVMASDLRTEMHQSIRNQTWALVAWTTALAGLIVAFGR